MISIELLKKKNRVIRLIRDFFEAEGYLEVDTPCLSPFVIPESTIEVFQTTYLDKSHNREIPLFLLPSPELWMKRLISLGSGNIFQISKSFRNCDQIGTFHSPEFTMLEWYTMDFDYFDSISIIERLLRKLALEIRKTLTITYQGSKIDLEKPFLKLSLKKAFQDIANENLDSLILSDRELESSLEKRNIFYDTSYSWETKFNSLFLTIIEPELPRNRPVVLYDYPSRIKTTAAVGNNQLYSERWELYMGGMELANCYTEERSKTNLESFLKEEAVVKERSSVKIEPDYNLLEYFNNFPLCSGVALGLERLIMILLDKKEINGVISFPISDIIEGKIK